jgi:hypothetical protein
MSASIPSEMRVLELKMTSLMPFATDCSRCAAVMPFATIPISRVNQVEIF